jgi:hypothetical protein
MGWDIPGNMYRIIIRVLHTYTYITLHYITWRYITLHYITLHYVSLFARAESLCELICTLPLVSKSARACASQQARLSLLVLLERAHVKCSRARAAHPTAGEAPYMNSYVLNQAKI